MKTFGRVLIIIAVFAVVMGITYFAVNAGGGTSNMPAFGERRFPDGNPQFQGDGFAPNGGRPEFGGERDRGGGWMFGLIKNIGIVAVIVMLIVLPKNFLQQQRRQVAPIRTQD